MNAHNSLGSFKDDHDDFVFALNPTANYYYFLYDLLMQIIKFDIKSNHAVHQL